MAHNVSNEYKQIIYSGDARNKIKILFNNVELENADRYCERMTVKSRIIANGSKVFSLNNFISKEIELVLHDIDTSIIQNQVSISIGTLVGNSYEYVPIGIFNIQDTPTNDKNKTIIKLRDNSVKFDFNYNAQPLIDENGGSATKLQILQDICTQASVTCNITSFIGYLDEIGIYDNTITARQYIANIAEQAGKIATINRNGELIFIDLNNLTTWEIPIDIVEKYENGTSFKIGQVVYEDGIVRYETPTSNDDTLFLDGSNNYINSELIKEQASSNDNSYYLTNTGESDLAYLELEGKTTQETRSGRNLFNFEDTSSVTSGVTVDGDGWITATFDNTSGSANKYMNYWTHNLALNTSTNYNIITEVKSVSGSGSLICVSSPNATSGQFDGSVGYSFGSLSNNVVKAETKTTKSSFTNVNDGIRTYVQFQAGQSGSITFRLSVLADTSITPSTFVYEAYGVSPSYDYPSELISVGYKNLFDKNNANVINGYLSGSMKIVAANDDRTIYIPCKPNTKYYVTKMAQATSSNNRFSLGTTTTIPQANTTLVDFVYLGNGTTATKFSITTGNTAKYLVCGIYHIDNSTTFDEMKNSIQIEESNQAHSYIPYGKYGVEVKLTGKNLFDKNTMIVNGGLNAADGVLASSDNFRTIYVSIKPNTSYTMQKIPSNRFVIGYANDYDITLPKTLSNISTYGTDRTELTLTTPNNVKVLFVMVSKISEDTTNIDDLLNSIQIEQGTQKTTFEDYQSNTQLYQLDNPIRSVENTRDLFYIKNNMLYVERKIGSVVLNGTETWTHDTTGQRYWRALDNVVTPADTNTKGRGMSNIELLTANQTMYTSGMDGIAIHPLGRIYISNDVYDTLTTKNVELQYLYANPFVEELGTIEMPQAYNEITNISINSGIITNSYIEYRKDKTQLEAILNEVNLFDIDSLKTGKILGNPAIDPYDLIQIHDKSKNLFDLDTYLDNAPLVNCTIEKIKNGFIMNFTSGADAMVGATLNSDATLPVNYRNGVIKVEPNTTYTISLSSSPKTYISYFNENYVATQNYTKLPVLYTPSKYTFTTNATTRYLFLRLGIQDSNYSSWIYQDVQVEKGNTATSYIPFKDETYITLATNDLTYTGVMINTFDTQIEEEAKEQNVFVNGEATFQKWARTKIDNVEGSITLQAGEINEANGRINETNLRIDKDGALLSVLANNSNIDVEYDSQGNPLSGEVREVTTTTGFTFNAEGMTIQDTSSNFRALHRNDGTYYYDGTTIVGQYTKDGSKQKDLDLFGIYTYGKNDINETPMFIAQLFTDGNGEEGFGHFYNRGD